MLDIPEVKMEVSNIADMKMRVSNVMMEDPIGIPSAPSITVTTSTPKTKKIAVRLTSCENSDDNYQLYYCFS